MDERLVERPHSRRTRAPAGGGPARDRLEDASGAAMFAGGHVGGERPALLADARQQAV
jgi:hypothetical protein